MDEGQIGDNKAEVLAYFFHKLIKKRVRHKNYFKRFNPKIFFVFGVSAGIHDSKQVCLLLVGMVPLLACRSRSKCMGMFS
jgi:hypothetical protein